MLNKRIYIWISTTEIPYIKYQAGGNRTRLWPISELMSEIIALKIEGKNHELIHFHVFSHDARAQEAAWVFLSVRSTHQRVVFKDDHLLPLCPITLGCS